MRKLPRGFWDHIKRKAPDTLYHYTSLGSLMKVVSSRSLLASDTRFLNDSKELMHVTTTIIDQIKIRLRHADSDMKPSLKRLLSMLENDERDPVYVISFSAKADDLSQWRGYTPTGQGVSIGFDTRALRDALELMKGDRHERARFLMLGKVIYLGDDEGMSFDKFITSACGYVNTIEGEVVRAVAVERLIVSAMPFYKHITFKDEHEWRIRISANSVFIHDPLPVECRLGRSSLVPAARLSFKGTNMENSFIKEIIVGPTPKTELSVFAIRQFLEAENLLGVAVRPSKVPYRDW